MASLLPPSPLWNSCLLVDWSWRPNAQRRLQPRFDDALWTFWLLCFCEDAAISVRASICASMTLHVLATACADL
jgi:hypothetical protein